MATGIVGLPEGATLKPIQGLPEGATLKPIQNAPQAQTTQPQGDWRDSVINSMSPMEGDHPFSNFALGVGQGVAQTVLHPIDSMLSSPVHSGQYPGISSTGNQQRDVQSVNAQDQQLASAEAQGRKLKQDFQLEPSHTVGKIVGPALVAKGLAKVAPAAIDAALPKNFDPYTPVVEKVAPITKAINPPASEWPSLTEALAHETGTIQDFAKRTGNPLKTNTDFANAAKGAAYESQRYFENQVLDKIGDDRIQAPQQYKIPSGKSGDYITINDLYKRIGQLNDELRSNYMKRREGQMREALANDSDIKAERDALDQSLYKEVAQRTKLTVDEVKAMRQNYGRLYQIADQTQAAVNDRLRSERVSIEGREVPKSMTEAAFRVANKVRGGPESIASRDFARVMSRLKMEPYKLPDVGAQSTNPKPMMPDMTAQHKVTRLNPTNPVNPGTE